MVLMLAGIQASLAASVLMSTPKVLDADTFEVDGTLVSLFGVHAPAIAQSCVADGADWPCGTRARAAVTELIADDELRCQIVDAYTSPMSVVCALGELNLSKWLVANGWALATGDEQSLLMQLERAARERGTGVFRDGFAPNDAWRRVAGALEVEGYAGCSSCDLRHQSLKKKSLELDTDSHTD